MNKADVTRELQAHADTARACALEHWDQARDAIAHGEDDNAIAHMIDAIRELGRAQGFVAAGEVLFDEEPS